MGEANGGDLSDPFPSLWDDETHSYRRPDQQEQRNMFLKLSETYTNLSALSVIFPWCILEFEDELPCYEDRIFLVAGLVAVYILDADGYPLGTTSMGRQGEGDPSVDPEHINLDLQPYHVPSFETFKYLHTCVEIAKHVSSYPKELLFELYPVPDEEFESLLPTLPSQFGSMTAFYVNGEHIMEMASCQVKIPNAKLAQSGKELIIDDTNYLLPKNGGKIHPGVLLECSGEVEGMFYEDSANTGIAVRKGEDIRLTCPAHVFQRVRATTGYHRGMVVGELDQTIGEDIGLVDPMVPLSNEFFAYDCTAKALIRTSDIRDDDIVGVDSCFTGPQKMVFVGTRTGKRKRRNPGPAHPNYYVVLEQGIYTSSDPNPKKPPVVRMGMCGTPLLRVGNRRNKKLVPTGDVLGFFLWLDEKSCNGSMLYSYAQPCDPLLDAGWEVAMVDKPGEEKENDEDNQQTAAAEGDDGSGKIVGGKRDKKNKGGKATSMMADNKISN